MEMKTGKQKSHDMYLACQIYHKWNGKNKFNASIQVHLSKIKKANEIEEKYQIARGGLVAILGLANYRGVKGNIPVMADGDPVKSYSRQDGRNYTPGLPDSQDHGFD
jgi:hypothetical protein